MTTQFCEEAVMENAQRVPVTRLSVEEVREKWKEVTDEICDMLLQWSPSRDQQTKYQDVLQFVVVVLLDASPSSHHLHLLLASLSPKIKSLFHSTCQGCIECLCGNAPSVDMESIKHLCICMQSHLALLMKGLEKLKELMSSAPQCVRGLSFWLVTCFNALASTLRFCKNVEVEHSWAFEQLAAQLGPMFKSSYGLLKVAIETVTVVRPEKLVENDEEVEGMEIFQKVLCSLSQAAEEVLHFDPTIVIMTWKAVGKTVCYLKTCPSHIEEACPIITSMCTAMRQQSNECVSHGIRREKKDPHSQFSKLLKSCRFFAILITKVVQEFELCHHLFAQCILDFLLELINSLPPSPYCKPLHKSSLADIEANLLVVCEPLCSTMVHCDTFLSLLTTPTDTMRERPFSWSILLCFLLKLFPKLPVSVQNYLLDSTTAAEVEPVSCRLLDSVYSCVRACYGELSLPVRVTGVQCIGMPLVEVTLYEHICVHLCATVAATPANHFGSLERVLLRELLGTDRYSVLLATDVWCFMARWGTSELCYSYVELLCQLVSSISPSSSSLALIHISSLLHRLVGLLAPQQQTDLCQQYLPSSVDSLTIWLHLPTHSLHPSLQTEVCSSLASMCSQLLQSECTPNTTWLCLQVLLTHDNCWHHISSSSLTSLVTLWEVSVAVATAGWKNTVHTDVVCSLAHLTSSLLPSFSSSQLIKVFQCIRMIIVTGSSPVNVLLAVASILSQCGSLELTQDMQESILSVVVDSFCHLFGHTHWLVLSSALEAFRKFAELTPHSAVVEQCVPPAVSDTVVAFLNKVPSWKSGSPPTTLDLLSLLKARHTLHVTLPLSTEHEPSNNTLELMEAISVMQSSWEKVRAHPIPFPAKAVEELTGLSQSIQYTLNTNQTD